MQVLGATPLRYDIAVMAAGKPAASERLLDFVAPVAFTIPAALAGSQAKARTAATASAAFALDKNGTGIGTITFAASGSTGSLSAASAISVAAGDRIALTAPSSQDSTLADLAITLVCTRIQ